MKNASFYVLTAALGLAGCGRSDEADRSKTLLMANNFETLEHWLPGDLASTLTHEQAHSGRTALKVDDMHEYSLTYKKPLGYFQLPRPARLRVSAWVLLPDAQAAATLVTTVTDPANSAAKPLFWEGLKLREAVHSYGKWTKVSQVVTLPTDLQDTHMLTFYLWHTGPSPAVYLDDLEVTREP
jgi:hypothetical protein